MKAKITVKFDINKIGNKPMIQEPLEKLLLEILNVQKNTVSRNTPR